MSTEPPVVDTTQPHATGHESPLHIAHEDHDHDPSNPHYFGLPIGVILAAGIAAISVGITLFKFFVLK
jgi:hypothetical protein